MQLTGLWLYITLILGFPFTEGDQNYANAVQLFRYKQLRAQNLLGRSGIKFKIIRIPPKRISISPPVLSSLRQVQVKRSKHHSKELLLPNSQSKKPPDFRYNFDYNRLIKEPFTNLDISMVAYLLQNSPSYPTNRDMASTNISRKDMSPAPPHTPQLLDTSSVGGVGAAMPPPQSVMPGRSSRRPPERRISDHTFDLEQRPEVSFPTNYWQFTNNTIEERDKMQLSQFKKEVRGV